MRDWYAWAKKADCGYKVFRLSIPRINRTHVTFLRQDSCEDFTPVHICATRERIPLYFCFLSSLLFWRVEESTRAQNAYTYVYIYVRANHIRSVKSSRSQSPTMRCATNILKRWRKIVCMINSLYLRHGFQFFQRKNLLSFCQYLLIQTIYFIRIW